MTKDANRRLGALVFTLAALYAAPAARADLLDQVLHQRTADLVTDARAMTTVLITGATGLVGRALTDAYIARGAVVHTAQRHVRLDGPAEAQVHTLDVRDADGLATVIARARDGTSLSNRNCPSAPRR